MSRWMRILAVTVVAGALLLPGAAVAGARAKPATTKTFTGTVASVTPSSKSFALREANGTRVTIHVTSSTRLSGVSSLTALRTGRGVIVTARGTTSGTGSSATTRWVATRVTAH
jgi:hypothetical protein